MIKKTLLGAAFAAIALGSFSVGVTDAKASDDKTLVIGTMWESQPLAMKPRRSRFFNESEILDTLVKLDYDLKPIPGLATAWDRVSPTVWQFKLRENVVFHDGTKLDAEAVKFSLERVIALLPYAADLLNIKSIKAVSRWSLRSKTPNRSQPCRTSFPTQSRLCMPNHPLMMRVSS